MENDKERTNPHQTDLRNTENKHPVHKEQFNELSELSLEARMNVADQIGVPVNNLGDAAATGTMQDRDNEEDETSDRMDREDNQEEMK